MRPVDKVETVGNLTDKECVWVLSIRKKVVKWLPLRVKKHTFGLRPVDNVNKHRILTDKKKMRPVDKDFITVYCLRGGGGVVRGAAISIVMRKKLPITLICYNQAETLCFHMPSFGFSY